MSLKCSILGNRKLTPNTSSSVTVMQTNAKRKRR